MVPYTLEGSFVLHQMFRVRWTQWIAVAPVRQDEICAQASAALAAMERSGSAVYLTAGHKGDIMLLHFRPSLDGLIEAELLLSRLALWEMLEPAASYVSVVELGLYESTSRIRGTLAGEGLEPGSAAWEQRVEEELARQRKAMEPRLYPTVPAQRYICFYPMDRKRGEIKNWYRLPFEDRARQMHEHGLVGRRYAGQVKQIISGSIGFDDWEWGVDLFSDDPLQFKKLIYEMRFDEVSADYALFGSFVTGTRLPAAELGRFLAGSVPGHESTGPVNRTA